MLTETRRAIGVSILILAACSGAFAQAPQIARGGVVNAASWASPITPGATIAIFGSNLAAKMQSASAPLPFALGGTSVTVNGVPAPILFVSPTQINVQVPASIAAPDSSIGAVPVVVTNSGGSSAPEIAGVTSTAPGFFSADGSGCGSAAALNIRPDGTASVNSPSNSAAPGDYIALFGTGFGLAAQQPSDGAAAMGTPPLQSVPRLFLDNNPVSSLAWAGLAPTLVGVD
ncbi:MAG TPA: IPT/TIG domain-containing protein, partial [Bryobacteraceae bacterium]|nr:IPT/TIG domain-containing protein [Bryobacteraceae bacterium]